MFKRTMQVVGFAWSAFAPGREWSAIKISDLLKINSKVKQLNLFSYHAARAIVPSSRCARISGVSPSWSVSFWSSWDSSTWSGDASGSSWLESFVNTTVFTFRVNYFGILTGSLTNWRCRLCIYITRVLLRTFEIRHLLQCKASTTWSMCFCRDAHRLQTKLRHRQVGSSPVSSVP